MPMRASAPARGPPASGSVAGGEGVPLQVEQRRRQVLDVLEPLVELAALLDLLHQRRRDGLAGLPVARVVLQDLGLRRPSSP